MVTEEATARRVSGARQDGRIGTVWPDDTRAVSRRNAGGDTPAAARAATPTECRGGIAASTVDSLSDLPLRVVRPAPGESAPDLAVFLTGDGGWAAIDKEISDSLARHGIPVVALNSREYLANKRTPQRVASDVARIIRYYGRSFGRSAVLLIGYSSFPSWPTDCHARFVRRCG